MNEIIVKCGSPETPNFYGFVFSSLKRASDFMMIAPYGMKEFKVLSSDKNVKHLIDCTNCKESLYECAYCSKVNDALNSNEERMNESFQEDI